MPPIKKILYDHWLILFGALLVVFLGSSELTSLKLLSHYILPFFSTWYIIPIILLSLVLIITLAKLAKSKGPSIHIISPPPTRPMYKYKETEQLVKGGGVKWKVWLGHDRLAGGEEDQRVWVEGPYCPKCLYELDRDKTEKKWHCLKCNQYIPISKELREDTIEKMIKIFTADLQRQRQKRKDSSSQR